MMVAAPLTLEMGKKIESLQVETCEASSEEDKKLDFSQIRTAHVSFFMELEGCCRNM